MTTIKKQCSRCKNNLDIEEFKQKRDKTYQKMCILCLEKNKKYKDKNKCEHGKLKERCVICGGSAICIHNKRKECCIECKGSAVCEHNKQRSRCKDCMNEEGKINHIIKKIINHSRESDKKYDRYDADHFIDKCFLEGLFEDSTNCAYCSVDFTYNERCDTLVTIERVNNDIGHIKSNCILACFKCNVRKVGQKT